MPDLRPVVAAVLAVAGLTACAPGPQSQATGWTSTIPSTTTPRTVSARPAITSPPPPPPPPCAAPVRACVSLSIRQAWLMTGGVVDYGPVPIAHGGAANPTPTGTFPVSWKDAENTSSIYGTPMPYSVFFAPGGIAFHEGSITEDSHGCVRLAPDAARVFFDNLTTGQLVQVVN